MYEYSRHFLRIVVDRANTSITTQLAPFVSKTAMTKGASWSVNEISCAFEADI